MDLKDFERQTQEHMQRRCREHLLEMEKLLKRPITFDYRYEHTRTAVAIAGKLAVEMKVDPALARIAAWLHDIAKCWDPGLDEAANREREQDHGRVGAREAAIFLESISFPRAFIDQVKQAVAQHVGLVKDYTLEEPLAALVWDADKLSKISFAGTLHYLGALLGMGGDLIDLVQFLSEADLELHRDICNSLNTEMARQWGERELDAAAGLRRQILAALTGNLPGT
ncbi:MAG: HD domain-containing protein [Bacillota bacterium]